LYGVAKAAQPWHGDGESEIEEVGMEGTVGFCQEEFETEQVYRQASGNQRSGRRGRHSGARPSGDRKYQVQHLWERHHKMLRLTLLGWQPRDIATELGCTVHTVTACVNSALGKRVLAEMQAVVDEKTIDVATKLQEMSMKAAAKLEAILDDEDTPRALQARIAMDNLDRTGHARQINVKGQFLHGVVTPELLEQIKKDAWQVTAGSLQPENPQEIAEMVDTVSSHACVETHENPQEATREEMVE